MGLKRFADQSRQEKLCFIIRYNYRVLPERLLVALRWARRNVIVIRRLIQQDGLCR